LFEFSFNEFLVNLSLSFNRGGRRALGEEPLVLGAIVPPSLDVSDINSVLIEGHDGDSAIDIGGKLVSLTA